jgi:hypothetical protein
MRPLSGKPGALAGALPTLSNRSHRQCGDRTSLRLRLRMSWSILLTTLGIFSKFESKKLPPTISQRSFTPGIAEAVQRPSTRCVPVKTDDQLDLQALHNVCREHIDPPQQVVLRNHLVEAKLVKQLPLISVLPSHHRPLSCRELSRNHCSLGFSTPFSTVSVKLRNTRLEQMSSALPPRTDVGLARASEHASTAVAGR